MSIDRNVYVGPIVRCVFPTKDVDVVTDRRCAKGHIGETHTSAKFCPIDGTAIVEKTKKVKRPAVYALSDETKGFELFEASDEDDGGHAFPKGEHVYVVNMQRSAARKFHLDDEWACFQPLSDTHIRDENAWFRSEYAASIAMLVKLYGEENVDVGWAILRWSS